jgi:hypothetical protein
VPTTIEPKPPEEEREAILTALGPVPAGRNAGGWAETALLEGVASDLDDP